MEALIKGSLLKNIVDAIKENKIDYASFDFNPSGLYLQSFAPNNLAFVSIFLKPETFEHYRCEQSTSIGFNLVHLSHVLEVVNDDCVITMKADNGEDNFVTISLENRARPGEIADLNTPLIMGLDDERLGRGLIGRRIDIGEVYSENLMEELGAELEYLAEEWEANIDVVEEWETNIDFAEDWEANIGDEGIYNIDYCID